LVLHAFEYGSIVSPETGGQLLEIETVYANAKRSLDDLLERARQLGITCAIDIERGIAAPTILDKIKSENIDLVILGTNSLRGIERLVFGSTAEEVLRKSPCPVMTVGPRVLNTEVTVEGPIIFATNFDDATIHAIRHAALLSQLMKSSVRCLHVLPRTLEGKEQNNLVPQIMNKAMQHVITESGAAIARPTCVTTYDNEVSNGIVDYARKERARLIVLGVRKASMMASHAPAQIAYQVITAAPCPVLTVAFSSHSRNMKDKIATDTNLSRA
jgi:nucleotide-binding universal stress UspA family protein